MVEFKVRCYDGDNNQMIGAEVTVYSEEGDKIGCIQVTSEKDFNDLMDRINGFDEKFVAVEQLGEEVSKLSVNASTLNDYSSVDFALANHTHSADFPPKNHAVNTNLYGLGTNSLYGHVKIVNGLSSSKYIDGEVLSAYQGKVLSDKISDVVKSNRTWKKVHNGTYLTIWYNESLKMCYAYYKREKYTGFKSTSKDTITLHKKGSINAAYCPYGTVKVPLYRGDVVIGILGDGSMTIRSENTISSLDIHASFTYPVI